MNFRVKLTCIKTRLNNINTGASCVHTLTMYEVVIQIQNINKDITLLLSTTNIDFYCGDVEEKHCL